VLDLDFRRADQGHRQAGRRGYPTRSTDHRWREKFAIPGLMNANVHLLGDIRFETLTRYMDRYEDLILEAAQVALKVV